MVDGKWAMLPSRHCFSLQARRWPKTRRRLQGIVSPTCASWPLGAPSLRVPATEKKPKGEVHEHWSLFSYDKARKAVMLRQFHQEGFVNTYRLMERRDDGKVLVFETEQIENLPEGWKARE
jgi:hypothetical protein